MPQKTAFYATSSYLHGTGPKIDFKAQRYIHPTHPSKIERQVQPRFSTSFSADYEPWEPGQKLTAFFYSTLYHFKHTKNSRQVKPSPLPCQEGTLPIFIFATEMYTVQIANTYPEKIFSSFLSFWLTRMSKSLTFEAYRRPHGHRHQRSESGRVRYLRAK